jgi:hypothetical protein
MTGIFPFACKRIQTDKTRDDITRPASALDMHRHARIHDEPGGVWYRFPS